jgi:D-3-phosphoglycerate dehydrogenase
VGKAVERPDAILVRSHDMHTMAIPRACSPSAARVGNEQHSRAEMSRRGVPVFNAPGANANAVKELVLAALLLAARNVVPALGFVSGLDARASDLDRQVEDGKKAYAGIELPRRTLGIIGLGAIGSLVADTAIKLGMNVVGFDPEITVDAAWRLPSSVPQGAERRGAPEARRFRHASRAAPAVTQHMIDAKRLAAMKPGSVLLNFARDALVDDEAVKAALRRGHLKYYLCDFPAATLMGEPGVVALPHLGASTEEAEANSAVMVVDQVREFLENGTIRNAVNFPNVDMTRESPYRVAIANANVPNMLGQISLAMGHGGLNIHNMVNKSRGEMAYTLVDVDSPCPTRRLLPWPRSKACCRCARYRSVS